MLSIFSLTQGWMFFSRAFTRSLYGEEVAVVAASRALASRADLNLPSKPTLLAALHRCRRRQFFARSLFWQLVARQSCSYCAKPCYALFLIERPQIRLFADIRIYTSNPLEPPPSRGPFATVATDANGSDF